MNPSTHTNLQTAVKQVIEDRDYQIELDYDIYKSWETNRNVLAVSPTGSGKSVVISKIVKKTQGGVCVVAHRQELVSQMSLHLARDGIYHNIISSVAVVKEITKQHLQKYGQSFYRNSSHVAVAGVDTIIRRHNSLAHWLPIVKLWIIDECFPAGTMVDDKPIETIKVGDYVTAFNEKTGEFSKREVKRLFKNPQPKYMVRLETKTHHVVESTENHPYWTKRGWVNACKLTVDDEVLIYENDKKQPHEEQIFSQKDDQNIEKNGTPTETSWREWEGSNQSRWGKSCRVRTSGTRYSQRQGSCWTRLESIQVFKSHNNDEQKESYVYNIEVDEEHTYTANGIVVHNCHHVLFDDDHAPTDKKNRDNKWGKAVRMFPNAKGLGVTATPLRLDGKGLGRHADGVFDDMVIGVGMRELINRGFLTDYKIYSPESINFNRGKIHTTASGELSEIEVNNAVKGSNLVAHDGKEIIGDVVKSYQKFANGLTGITFVPSTEIGEQICKEYNDAGIPAEFITAKTPGKIRSSAVDGLTRGELKQLVNIDLFGEGFDLPAISVVSMVRPTQSYGLYVQMFGRVLRLMEGKNYGIIIDHVGNVAGQFGHGLPDAHRTWTLDAREKRSGINAKGLNPIKTCNACAFSYERYMKGCPACGHVDVPVERTIEQVDGSLAELSPAFLAKLRGEVLSIDRPIDDQVNEYVGNLNPCIQPLHASRHIATFRKKVEANIESQSELRAEMAQWAGYRRAEGRSDDEIFKQFYIAYGVDWLNAQALKSIEADKLKEGINYYV